MIYDHTFKHLLETRWLFFLRFRTWVAENSEIGIFPHKTYNESKAAFWVS